MDEVEAPKELGCWVDFVTQSENAAEDRDSTKSKKNKNRREKNKYTKK